MPTYWRKDSHTTPGTFSGSIFAIQQKEQLEWWALDIAKKEYPKAARDSVKTSSEYWEAMRRIAGGFADLAKEGIVGLQAIDLLTKVGWWQDEWEKNSSVLEMPYVKGYIEEKKYWEEKRLARVEHPKELNEENEHGLQSS